MILVDGTMIHITRGVYANDSFKDNGVPSENLAEHIQYNLRMRPGRAFFLDGVCIYKGYLTDAQVEWHTEHFKKYAPKISRDTQPYQ